MYTYKIELAIKAATILHKNQVRKGEIAIPYVSHLYAVTLILLDYTDDEDTVVASLLHDTLEDTDYTADELQEDFGGKVREYVEALSEPPDDELNGYTWKERKSHYIKKLKNAPQPSLLIAAADKIHNMRSMVEEYYDDHSKFLSQFEGSLKDRLFTYQEIANVINRNLKSDIVKEFNHVFEEFKNFITDVEKTKSAEK